MRQTFSFSTMMAAIAAMATLQAGCDNQHLLGDLDGGAGTAGTSGTGAINGGTGATAGSGELHADAAAALDGPAPREVGVLGPAESWTGYIENYQFPMGSDVIKIAFAADPAGQMVGTVTFGAGAPPPPATDPNVGYPPALAQGSGLFHIDTFGYVAEGFGYSMQAGTETFGLRLRFGVGLWELWGGWCALETPVAGYSSCLPNWGGGSTDEQHCFLINPANGQKVDVDCGKLSLCDFDMMCACAASSCAVRDIGSAITFDMAITGGRADGSIAGTLGEHNVHFIKDP